MRNLECLGNKEILFKRMEQVEDEDLMELTARVSEVIDNSPKELHRDLNALWYMVNATRGLMRYIVAKHGDGENEYLKDEYRPGMEMNESLIKKINDWDKAREARRNEEELALSDYMAALHGEK